MPLPLAAGVAQVPLPHQKVKAVAPVPELRLVTGRLPVTPAVSETWPHAAVVPFDVRAYPVVPMARRVELFVPFPMIRSPVVVTGDRALNPAAAVVWPVPPLRIGSVPVTPLESGKPVALVRTSAVGVPSAGVTSVGDVERTVEPVPVDVVTPVPPLATASVPASVIVPDVVTGPPLVVRPVVPPLTLMLTTEPAPAGPVGP